MLYGRGWQARAPPCCTEEGGKYGRRHVVRKRVASTGAAILNRKQHPDASKRREWRRNTVPRARGRSASTAASVGLCSLPAPLPPGETEENTNNIEEERTACRAARAIALPAAGSSQQEEAAAFSARKRFSCGEAAEKAAWHSPQNGPPPTGLPQRMGQLQPPVIPVRFEICAEGWQLLLGQELHLPRGKAAASSSPGTVSMQEAAQGTGRRARAGTRPQQEQPWHTDTGG
ncbi:uncharacterized protein LOC130266040 [Oenanthe melanoleuca]|uniref:uncharacterized protein LOC130266040 n=1 Tax=Oenanthe melanoleuca TaxID=2939378 RepID=UPI0024C122C6|nr:uncharacterized protein LOC130266040 [Oenanthe melanoleuca]